MNTKDENIKKIVTKTGTEMKVPVEGSLGLLALGSVGIRAWKAAKKEYNQLKSVKK